MSLNLPKDLYGVTSPPHYKWLPSVVFSFIWQPSMSRIRICILDLQPAGHSSSLYPNEDRPFSLYVRPRADSLALFTLWFSSSWHSWTLFIRLPLTVPLLRSCCISYSIDALARYSACGLIHFSIDSLFLVPASFGLTPVFFFLYPVILWSRLIYSLLPHNLIHSLLYCLPKAIFSASCLFV